MRNFDFIKHRKLFACISAAVILVGLLCNIFMGVELDINFKGGTLLKYSYEGALVDTEVSDFVKTKLPDATVELVENGESGLNTITITMTTDLDSKTQTNFKSVLAKEYPNNSIEEISTNSLQPSSGRMFFIKCLYAIALASVFLMIYVGLRFRKIGGLSAGVMALLALLHDILIAYFVFVIFRIPLNDNFVAVVLTILGYSLNGTIVVYDRIRENRTIMDKQASIEEVVNVSLNQSFTRSLNTSICTFIAIGTVAVIALINSLSSIISFALPMTVGVVAGFFSSTFLCSPLWVLWVKHTERRKALQVKKAKAAPKAKAKKKNKK